jgi:hypothetical protein
MAFAPVEGRPVIADFHGRSRMLRAPNQPEPQRRLLDPSREPSPSRREKYGLESFLAKLNKERNSPSSSHVIQASCREAGQQGWRGRFGQLLDAFTPSECANDFCNVGYHPPGWITP